MSAKYSVVDRKPIGKTTYELAITNRNDGADTEVTAHPPLGVLKIWSKWRVTAHNGDWILTEDLRIEANRAMISMVKGNIEKTHPEQHQQILNAARARSSSTLKAFDADPAIAAIVLTGSDKAFAAGADIAEMQPLTFGAAYASDFILDWSAATTTLRKPLLAAVNGYALGGGCELAMMADILYASRGARFGQPEVTLGTIPGAGGSQRLARAIGKARAMEVVLTNRMVSGEEAAQWGLAARCFETAEECVEGALAAAERIAGFSQVAIKAAKEVVNKSQETGLREGVEFERRVFHGLFGSRDQKIGMKAFVEKDKNPKWENQ
ncbi:hypothetical protein FH972_021949 [Carpinus fangiana]|uniref:Enoyl-CoA hydratase n=1 Tax=Carpinus fangiana TaxID=176857 RepID=A0A5N6KR65_9ROSI|nr:hypothetical protein FH972_021949 [Carpinus fangiana]